jgi:hypothetical protein
VYVVGDLAGAVIAVAIIILVRGMPQKAEREAAEGGDVHPGNTRRAGAPHTRRA